MTNGLIINAGSRMAESGKGWTNTIEKAREEAERWLGIMRSQGMWDVDLLRIPDDTEPFEGRWRFTFRHRITGSTATLDTPGIDNMDAYVAENWHPRVYWNGESSGTPELDDFAAPGFEKVQTFRPLVEGEVVDEQLSEAPSRDDRIRAALAAKVSVAQLMRETGLSRARIYQIRDRRR
jgi:hypothetical protein